MLTVHDKTELRPDLASRRELKYVISTKDVIMVRKILSKSAKPVVYPHAVSWVRSLYFDDPSLSACSASIYGLGRLIKLRLRWKDSLLPRRHAFSEIKWRVSHVTGKQQLLVDTSKDLSEVKLSERWRELCGVCETSNFLNQAQDLEPVVVVEYRREHFVANNGRLRFTLDNDLRFFDQRDGRDAGYRFPLVKKTSSHRR